MITDWTEPTTVPRSPIVTGRNVSWSEEWPMDAPLRPGRRTGRQQPPQAGDETSTQTQVGVDDLPSATTSSASSNTEQRSGSHVTGRGDPLERFYEIEDSE
jgi:hypothetical protein